MCAVSADAEADGAKATGAESRNAASRTGASNVRAVASGLVDCAASPASPKYASDHPPDEASTSADRGRFARCIRTSASCAIGMLGRELPGSRRTVADACELERADAKTQLGNAASSRVEPSAAVMKADSERSVANRAYGRQLVCSSRSRTDAEVWAVACPPRTCSIA